MTKVQALEIQKNQLIEQYIRLQDEADEYNKKIYDVCCQIQVLNEEIEKLKKKRQQEKAKSSAQYDGNSVG